MFIYRNPKLEGRCIHFAYYGSVLFKKLFKTNQMNCKVQVKKYVINNDDPNYSHYHYYIEIKTPTGKLIIDNCGCYNFWEYRDKFKPCGTITKENCRNVNKYLQRITPNYEEIEIINGTIIHHFSIIKKYYNKKI